MIANKLRLKNLLWLFKTHRLKSWIAFEERYGLFDYARWVRQHEPGPETLAQQRAGLPRLAQLPIITVVLSPSPANNEALSARTLAGLKAQSYPYWDVKPLVYQPGDTALQAYESPMAEQAQRAAAEAAMGFAPSSLADLLEKSTGEWIVFLAAGDTLSPHAFYTAIAALQAHPQADLLYPDEDRLSADGLTYHSPFCKPDFSPELLLSVNYLRGAFLRREHLLPAIRSSASDGEALLRCVETARQVVHLPHILLHCGEAGQGLPGALAGFCGRPFSVTERVAHLRRSGLREPRCDINPGGERFVWESDLPLVSIIIPSKNKVAYLQRCIESLQRITEYPHYEILVVDNDSRDPATLDYYTHLPTGVRLLENHDPFNYSVYNNRGVSAARGDLLLFLNNDIEVLEPHWLDELARWAMRPEVGAVGAKLLYPDGAIQHAGIVVGMEGHGSHVFGGMDENSTGPWGSPGWYRNVSALTGACLMMRRQVFEQIGGFDEAYLLVFNDIEICVRTRAHGYRLVYNPFVRLFHYEGKSRGHYIPPADIRLGYQHLKDIVARGDPYYNPQLSYAVRRPTLRRAGEEDRQKRLQTIASMQGSRSRTDGKNDLFIS
ncbi:MAG: glycosyltransferase [Chloroflexota bacterium]